MSADDWQTIRDALIAFSDASCGGTRVRDEPYGRREDALAAVARLQQELAEARRILAKGWDDVVADDKARAIKAEIHAEAAEAALRETRQANVRLAELLNEWLTLGSLQGGGYGGTLKARTVAALAAAAEADDAKEQNRWWEDGYDPIPAAEGSVAAAGDADGTAGAAE